MRCKVFLILVGLILFANLVYAGFNFSQSGSSITTQYEVSKTLKAKINISFDNQSLYSYFNDSMGNSISLKDLLNKNINFNGTVNETSKTVSSDFQMLSFNNANFSMPSTTGNFSYKLNFTNTTLFSEKIIIIPAEEGFNSVEKALNDKSDEINNLKLEIKKFDLFTQSRLNESLDIVSLESKLEKIRKQYENASFDKYSGILKNISEIEVPLELSESTSADSISFYPERNNIDLDIVKSIAGGDYEIDKEDEYIDALIMWGQENLKTEVTFKEISASYEDSEEVILRTFEFTFDKRKLKNDAYFIIEKMDELVFKEDYSEKEKSGYLYINIKGISGNKIIFSTAEYVDFVDVPAFVSPSLNELSLTDIGEYIDTQKEWKMSKWILFVLIIVLLILMGIVGYIILQIWYKRKYENYLFKNRNNLYNILTYINNAKKKGMSKGEVVKNLKKAKWKTEQINYALKKYEGKKIAGIIGSPFKKVISKIDKSISK